MSTSRLTTDSLQTTEPTMPGAYKVVSPSLMNIMCTEEPEYLDSFFEALPLVSGRRSHRQRTQPQRLKMFRENKNFSGKRHELLSLDYNIGYRPNRSSNLQKGTITEERCPCCNEVLHSVDSSAVAVSKHGTEYSDWMVPKPQQRVYLPHYCTFVDTKMLHDRGYSSSRDRGQPDEDRFPGHRVPMATPRHGRRVPRYDKLDGVTASGALVNDKEDMTGANSSQSDTATPCVSVSQSGAFGEGGLSGIQLRTAATDITSPSTTALGERDDKSASCCNEADRHSKNEQNGSGKSVHGFGVETSLWQQDTPADGRTHASQTQEQCIQISPESDQTPTTVQWPETQGFVAGIPELPNVNTSVLNDHRSGCRLDRRDLIIPKQLDKKLKSQGTNEEEFTFYEFGDFDSTSQTGNVATNEGQGRQEPLRTIISVKTVRFELPVDMKSLETLSPQDYVKNHCRMISHNEKLCLRIFNKHKGKNGTIHGKSTLFNALREVSFSTMPEEQGQRLCDLLEINDDTVINFKLFAGITAVAERLAECCSQDKDKFQKDNIESADFYSLDWKLQEIQVRKDIRVLLHLLL